MMKRIINAYSRPQPPSVNQYASECQQLEAHVSLLKDRIKRIDGFFKDIPELKKITEEHICKYGEFIAPCPNIPKRVAAPDDWVGRRGELMIESNILEHQFRERKLFVEQNPEVYACFLKYAQETSLPQILNNPTC